MLRETRLNEFIVRKESAHWVYYSDTVGELLLDPSCCGKWMYMTSDFDRADALVRNAVLRGVVYAAKCGTKLQMETAQSANTVCCFYLNGNDVEAHRRVIKYFLDNNLIRRTKAGRLYNISFKFDSQTLAGEYGDDFHAEIRLADFVNLDTGEFLGEKK